MNEIKVDKNVAALKLIEILLEKGMINQATYTNIVKHANSHISQAAKPRKRPRPEPRKMNWRYA